MTRSKAGDFLVTQVLLWGSSEKTPLGVQVRAPGNRMGAGFLPPLSFPSRYCFLRLILGNSVPLLTRDFISSVQGGYVSAHTVFTCTRNRTIHVLLSPVSVTKWSADLGDF